MENALVMMCQTLEQGGGYSRITEDMDEDNLGTKEFFVARIGRQDILCLGSGHSGDMGCKIKFYFVEGQLMGHAAFEPEED